MSRQACLHFFLLLAGLFWLPAQAQAQGIDIKSMILMPGPVIQAHAEEEKQCESCHSSFDKSAQDALCLDCHEQVDSDRQRTEGFHGRSPAAANSSCKTCHKDHKGRDYDSVPLDRDTFDHRHTDFELLGAHSAVACESCHSEGTSLREAPTQCFDCHQDQDPHGQALGKQCDNCHEPRSWKENRTFDHSETDFPLRGHHETLACASCHAGQKYSFEKTECISCHRVQDVHLGRYGESCDRCHSQRDWNSRAFEHAVETGFRLTGAHKDLACKACHFEDIADRELETGCVSCHGGSDVHGGRHGKQCEDCHNTTDWGGSTFDHNKETGWPLRGGHEELACMQCHRGSLEEKLETDCHVCHGPDDVHGSASLADCSLCHTPRGWKGTAGFDHELTQFPLEGMHAIASCQACHESHQFHLAQGACVDCHEEDDPHESGLGQRCESCHSPNGWQLWSFDHEAETGFGLVDAHSDLSCGSCHRGSRPADVPGTCAGCHASDDRHDGQFGENCGRCHNSDSFGDVQWSR
jgi:hypothetical protein